nr:transmembrane emp24 domain-containing protein p24beta2 [Tanacetum cinerariifolium]
MMFQTIIMVVVVLCLKMTHVVDGIRFVIDREECLSHNIEYEGDTVHVSFVVIKAESPWHFSEDGVDLVIKDPTGELVYDVYASASEMHEFIANKKGLYNFCFTNKSPYHETVDFDVQAGHFAYYDQHAKDEHIKPLFDQIAKLEEALYNIQFEQHWLQAENDRQAVVNEKMGKRAVHKALIESAALIAASILQVYLLQRLFERKLGSSRVLGKSHLQIIQLDDLSKTLMSQ